MHTHQRLQYVMSSRACCVEPSHAGEVRDVRDHKLINDDDEPLKVAVAATQFGSCHVDPSQGQELPEGSLTEYGMCDHRLAIRSSMQTRTNTDRQQAKNKSAAAPMIPSPPA